GVDLHEHLRLLGVLGEGGIAVHQHRQGGEGLAELRLDLRRGHELHEGQRAVGLSVSAMAAMLIPARCEAQSSTASAGAGKGIALNSSGSMPWDSMVALALFWLMIIAAFLSAKAVTDLVPSSNWALEGLTTLCSCMRSRYRRMPSTTPSSVKVGFPSASLRAAPFWVALMKAKWLFSV